MSQIITSYSKEDLKEIFTEVLEEYNSKTNNNLNTIEINNNRLFTIDEVCKELHISKATLHSLINNNLIESSKVGRRRLFTQEAIHNCLNRG